MYSSCSWQQLQVGERYTVALTAVVDAPGAVVAGGAEGAPEQAARIKPSATNTVTGSEDLAVCMRVSLAGAREADSLPMGTQAGAERTCRGAGWAAADSLGAPSAPIGAHRPSVSNLAYPA
jgi:hypothetical protein